jgi:biotin synthase
MRHDWTLRELRAVHDQPFPDLILEAQTVHRQHFSPLAIQRSTLLSVKTGGCPENCSYCPQSAHYDTGLTRHGMLDLQTVRTAAQNAKDAGSTRFCIGAAWREVKDNAEFEHVLEMVQSVSAMGMEVCCTLGMLSADQADKLKDAGCHAYNHNLDTSPEFYGKIISTRTYEDRLDTLRNVRESGMTVCCGGIIGMGESVNDRLGLLMQIAAQSPHPESVPINALQAAAGTPLENQKPVDPIDFVRMIATARIVLPTSFVRLSAGRIEMDESTQALCFLAGANSIFAGDKLLTMANPGQDKDHALVAKLGMHFMDAAESVAQERPLRAAISA